jgi:hypothetical protein
MRKATRSELRKVYTSLKGVYEATEWLCERLLASGSDTDEDPTSAEFDDLRSLQAAIIELQGRFSHLKED